MILNRSNAGDDNSNARKVYKKLSLFLMGVFIYILFSFNFLTFKRNTIRDNEIELTISRSIFLLIIPLK